MRIMEIRRFVGGKINLTNLETLIKRRLINDRVVWPEQAIALAGYMIWPNASDAGDRWLEARRPFNAAAISSLLRRSKIAQQHWARVADIVHLHRDIAKGGHQERRGGASIGKAISLVDANAKSKGTGQARLWEIWKTYKDVAHLLTAAVLVSADAQTRHRAAPYGIKSHQFQPLRLAMLIPELVISVAMDIEDYGLRTVSSSRSESLFDSETLWRVPSDINLTPIPPPDRKLRELDIAALNARRAGNRGKANRREPSPEIAREDPGSVGI